VAAFVNSVRQGKAALVRPEEARRALETALMVEEAYGTLADTRFVSRYAAHA
jgi:hypothetical protein